MKCPNCGRELSYPEVASEHMRRYMTAVTVSSLCCGKAVRIIPRVYIEAMPTKGITEDDWGNPCNTSC